MRASERQRTLFLHIGTEKTGTSTLQLLAHQNRNLLAENGLLYPKTAARVAHGGLTLYALGDTNSAALRHAFGLKTDEDIEEYNAALIGRLRAEVKKTDCQRLLLSNEHLSSRVSQVREISRLVDGLREVCADIRVIVYLRPQHELALSTYSTAVKGGRAANLKLNRKEHSYMHNYDAMLSNWEGVVGIENITVRLFQPKEFVGGSLIDDFFHVLGIAIPPGLSIPEPINTSFDADTLQFARIGNSILPRSERKNHGLRGGLLGALAQISTGPKFTAAGTELAELDALCREGNERVARRYFPDRKGVLFPPFSAIDTPDTPPLLPERAVEIAIELWRMGRKRKARAGNGPAAYVG